MKELKSERIRKSLRHAAAEFLLHESNRTSLITVTNVVLSRKRDKATVLITVLPETQEQAALEFASRQGGALRDFLKKRVSLQRLPYISFAIDRGEKNRQKIDLLSQNS